jgi:hypothetical protein
MIFEIQEILQEGMNNETVEPFDDGSYQVDINTLQKIYTAGYKDGSHKSRKGNNNKNNESVINDNLTITDKYNTGDKKNG